MLSQEAYNTMPVPQPHNISGTIEINLEWLIQPNDFRPIVTEPLEILPYVLYRHLTIKPMANTTVCAGILCHTMQLSLSVFYMHIILQVSLG
jgi:hypothetical protein